MTGVIIGRFIPPHHGHMYLINVAKAMVDTLYIFLCSMSTDRIPGNIRLQWMHELCPQCMVIHITQENPKAHRGKRGAISIWAETIQTHLSEPPQYVFAAEQYGWELAEKLTAQFIPVDTARSIIPVSASAIRHDPWSNWQFIAPPVCTFFTKHVLVMGTSEYAKSLASALDTILCPHPAALPSLSLTEQAKLQNSIVQTLAQYTNGIMLHTIPPNSKEELTALLPNLPAVNLIIAKNRDDAKALKPLLTQHGNDIPVLTTTEASPAVIRSTILKVPAL